MKLIIGIAQDRDKRRLFDALVEAGIQFTTLASTGGFLRRGNVTVLIGVEGDDVDRVMAVFRERCGAQEDYVSVPSEYTPLLTVATLTTRPVKVKAGGAIVFVVDVERTEVF